MTRRVTFTQAEINRAMKAAAPVGYEVRIEGDVMRLLPTTPDTAKAGDPLEAELAEWASKHGYG